MVGRVEGGRWWMVDVRYCHVFPSYFLLSSEASCLPPDPPSLTSNHDSSAISSSNGTLPGGGTLRRLLLLGVARVVDVASSPYMLSAAAMVQSSTHESMAGGTVRRVRRDPRGGSVPRARDGGAWSSSGALECWRRVRERVKRNAGEWRPTQMLRGQSSWAAGEYSTGLSTLRLG